VIGHRFGLLWLTSFPFVSQIRLAGEKKLKEC
jgi:hypothetical protein